MNTTLRFSINAALFIPIVGICAPDEEALGKSRGYPIFKNSQNFSIKDEYLVGSLSHADQVYKSEKVKSGPEVYPLEKSEKYFEIKYNHKTGLGLEDYLNRNRVTGLIIIKDGKVLVEKYQYDRTKDMRFFSASMSKSITALLIGIALQEGKIKSLDDEVNKYVPALKRTAYSNVSIRNLLRMLSGAKFSQQHQSGSDNNLLNQRSWFRYGSGGVNAIDFVEEQLHPQGTTFNYSAGDTFVLGLVLRAAIGGGSVADYMSEKLWKPLGAESDAAWIVDSSGTPVSNCCFTATLRDYARLGLLLANNGNFNGKQIINKDYLLEATAIELQPDVNKPRINGKAIGYGYQFWLHPIKTRTFAMYGHYGQSVFVQPETQTVIVMTQAWAANDHKRAESERYSFHLGVLNSIGADGKIYR